MSTRSKKYSDYGLTDSKAQELIKYCRSGRFCEHDILLECAQQSNQSIAQYLVETITHKISYEKLVTRYSVPIDKNSFYGYRRKCVALLHKKLNT